MITTCSIKEHDTFQNRDKGEGCLAKLAVVLCLVSATSYSVAADMTVWTTVVGDWLRERPLFEAKWKLRVLCSMANFSCIIVCQQPLGNSSTKLQLCEFLV